MYIRRSEPIIILPFSEQYHKYIEKFGGSQQGIAVVIVVDIINKYP